MRQIVVSEEAWEAAWRFHQKKLLGWLKNATPLQREEAERVMLQCKAAIEAAR